MVGIYKITSPTGRIYIGQAVDIKRRWAEHKRTALSSYSRLYRSFHKHGVQSHLFEVIEECSETQLNDRERYWQDFYKVTTKKGLNCNLQAALGRSGKLSKEVVRQRQSTRMLNKGYSFSEEWRKKQSDAKKGWVKTDEHIEKIKQARKQNKIGYKPVKNLKTLIVFNSIKEAAEYYKCSREIIYGKIKKGEIGYLN